MAHDPGQQPCHVFGAAGIVGVGPSEAVDLGARDSAGRYLDDRPSGCRLRHLNFAEGDAGRRRFLDQRLHKPRHQAITGRTLRELCLGNAREWVETPISLHRQRSAAAAHAAS
jgi:hypothetical protein